MMTVLLIDFLLTVKIFGDGALGSFGAAMKEPYSDNPSERGILISDEASFQPLFKQVSYSR